MEFAVFIVLLPSSMNVRFNHFIQQVLTQDTRAYMYVPMYVSDYLTIMFLFSVLLYPDLTEFHA